METSPLQLDAYFIDEITAKVNTAFDPTTQEYLGQLTVSPQHLIRTDDGDHHQLVLTVTYLPQEGSEASLPYYVEITARGFYHWEGADLDDDQRNRMLALNGSSILYGLMRAEVAQVTALGQHGTMLLPTVNLLEAFAAQEGDSQSSGATGLDQ